jgi:hypothetical protein
MAGTLQCGPFLEDSTFTPPNGTTVPGTRPLGQAFSSNGLTTSVNSNYNSLQLSFERRISALTFLAAYTYGKAIDDASNFYELTNQTNARLSRSLSNFDIRHNFVISYNYEIPALPQAKGWSKSLV